MEVIRIALLAALTSCAAVPVAAQELNCAPRDMVMADMQRQGYQLSFLGETDGQGTLVIVTGAKGWLSVVDMTDGRMCIVGMGVDWQLKQSGVEG